MLNDAKLRNAKPRDKAYKLTDSHSLYLLVKPSGGKLWRWNYAYDGMQKSMNFGIYPMVSLVQAREKRNEARAILDEGKDPAIVKKLTIEANRKAAECTFKKIEKEWKEMLKSKWASAHANYVIRILDSDIGSASCRERVGQD